MKSSPVIISPMRHAGVLVAFAIAVVLSVLVLVLSALTTPLPAEAHAPDVVLSGVGAATVDGQLAPGEWDSAGKIDFLVNLPLSDGGGTTPGTLFVMNDGFNLYLGVKVMRPRLNANNIGFGLDQVAFEFDNNHNGGPLEEGDDILLLSPGLSFFGLSDFFDEVRTSRPPCPPGIGLLCGVIDTQLGVPGTNDGAGAATNNGSFSFFEMSHPLDSADNLNDFSLTPGSAVGFSLVVNLSSVTPFCTSECHASTPFPSSGGGGDIVIAPTLSQEAKLTAGDAASDDQFGAAVAISGETAVIGAPVDDTAAGPNAGSAYVFVRSGTGWSQQAKLTASDASAGALFGFSVAVAGDTVVVGASGDNMLAGSAYVFARSGTSWSQQAKLTASDAASGDRFGDAVGISGDTVVVGASDAASDAGAAYVFVRSGTSWRQQAKLTASDAAAFDLFGRALAVTGDSAVIGVVSDATAAGTNAGSAYVFVRSGTSWSQQAKLTASDAAAFDTFGLSVAVSGDTAVVGAISDDTDAGPDAGSAYVFARSGTSWSQQAKLTASDAAASDQFGRAVAVSGDTAVVGAPFDDTIAGSVYLFVRSG